MEQQKHPDKRGLLGKLSPGEKKLDGKTFYLDRVKKRSTTLLLEVITLFGGKIESFLHKEVSFVVTGCLEELTEREASDGDAKTKAKTASEEATPSKQRESGLRHDRLKQSTSRPSVNACGSRGKALLEKAILNKERLQTTSVLTNARSWGVKILYADDVIGYLKLLSRESFDIKSKKSEKVYNKQSSNAVKAAPLRSPYLKIEDSSRKYKPLHMQSMNFPTLYYSGRYSPFECPPPPRFDKWTEPEEKKNKENKVAVSTEDKCQTPLSCNPSPWKPRKKDAYCECCRQTFNNQEEHLMSNQHRAFVLEASNYIVVDQLVAALVPGFNPDPPPQPEEIKLEALTIPDACDLEPLTDMETEDAVKGLQTQKTDFKHDTLMMIDSVSPSIDNPQLETQQSLTNPNVDIPSLPLSPVMPVLEMMPQEPPLLTHHDLKPLSPCPVNICQNSNPFPPVLSPQMPDLYTHSSYLEPPVLSPQQLPSQEPKDEPAVQIESQSCSSECFPVDPHHSTTDVITAAESPEETQLEIKVCYNSWERRSRSLPRQSMTATNSKKRSRSASPESSLSKRRRTDEMGGLEAKRKQESNMTKDKDDLFFKMVSDKSIQAPKPVRTLSSSCTMENQDSVQAFSMFSVPQESVAGQWPPFMKPPLTNAPFSVDKSQNVCSSQPSELSNSHSTSVCIESALIPDVAALSSSDSDWDCELLSCLSAPRVPAPTPSEPTCELDRALLQQPCPWTHNSSYESRLHSALQPPPQPMAVDASAFSRSVVQIVEVQH